MKPKDWELRLKDVVKNNPECEACKTNSHRCPGCGEPTSHKVRICDGCVEFYSKGL